MDHLEPRDTRHIPHPVPHHRVEMAGHVDGGVERLGIALITPVERVFDDSRLGSREPEAAPLRFFTSLGAVTIPGACNISRPLGRASALLFRNDARSVASGGLLFFRGPVSGAERSPHAPAPRGSDIGPRVVLAASSFAGRLPEWNDPRPRQSPEEWKPAMRLLILPPIASSGSAETSSRPGLHTVIAVARSRRQDWPPSGPPLAWS